MADTISRTKSKRDHSTGAGARRAAERLRIKLAAWPALPEGPPSRQVRRRVALKAAKATRQAVAKLAIRNRNKRSVARASA